MFLVILVHFIVLFNFATIFTNYFNQNIQTKIIIIMKSFKKQAQQLFAYAGYKTNGIYLLPKVQYVNSPTMSSPVLTYKIDIAHQLYKAYQQQQFKYSEKGVTPKLIAEEMFIYLYPSEHINIQIDSFGYFIVTPSLDYYGQMVKNILSNESVRHTPLVVKNLNRQEWVKKTSKTILYQMENLSLSSLRIALYLQKIAKKYQIFEQVSHQNILKIIDCTLLQDKQVQSLLRSKLIDIRSDKDKLIINKSINPQQIISLCKNTQTTIIQHYYELNSEGDKSHLIGGCLRHRIIQYTKKYSIFNQSNIQLFGQIFPKITLDQLYKTYPSRYTQQLEKIMQFTLKFKTKLPINLNNLENNNKFIGLEMGKKEDDLEQLLVLLDYLGDDKLIQANWKLRNCRLKQSPIYKLAFQTLNNFFAFS